MSPSCMLACLVCARSYQESIHGYVARDKQWVKKQLYSHLRAQTAG